MSVTAIGIRKDDVKYEVGDHLPVSRVWDDNEPTDDTLSGTSAIGVWVEGDRCGRFSRKSATKLSKLYFGDYSYLIGGEIAGDGEDEGEIIIRNARVLKVLSAKTEARRLLEMVVPVSPHAVYYHGTKSAKIAMDIVKNGLCSKDSKSCLMSVDKNYLTPYVAYACMFGSYIVAFRGSDLTDVEPDEDTITMVLNNNLWPWLNKLAADRGITRDKYSFANSKKIAGWLTDEQKQELIKIDGNLQHVNGLKPFAAWQVDTEDPWVGMQIGGDDGYDGPEAIKQGLEFLSDSKRIF